MEQESKTTLNNECCKKKNDERSHCKMKSEKKDCCHNEQIVFEQDNDLELTDKSTVNLEEISLVLVSQLLLEL